MPTTMWRAAVPYRDTGPVSDIMAEHEAHAEQLERRVYVGLREDDLDPRKSSP